jgi:hypothetical protein
VGYVLHLKSLKFTFLGCRNRLKMPRINGSQVCTDMGHEQRWVH